MVMSKGDKFSEDENERIKLIIGDYAGVDYLDDTANRREPVHEQLLKWAVKLELDTFELRDEYAAYAPLLEQFGAQNSSDTLKLRELDTRLGEMEQNMLSAADIRQIVKRSLATRLSHQQNAQELLQEQVRVYRDMMVDLGAKTAQALTAFANSFEALMKRQDELDRRIAQATQMTDALNKRLDSPANAFWSTIEKEDVYDNLNNLEKDSGVTSELARTLAARLDSLEKQLVRQEEEMVPQPQKVMTAEDSSAVESEIGPRPQEEMAPEDSSVPAVEFEAEPRPQQETSTGDSSAAESETKPKPQEETATEDYSVPAVESTIEPRPQHEMATEDSLVPAVESETEPRPQQVMAPKDSSIMESESEPGPQQEIPTGNSSVPAVESETAPRPQQVVAPEDSSAAKSEAELRPQQMMTSEDPSVPAVESETEPKRQQVTASEDSSIVESETEPGPQQEISTGNSSVPAVESETAPRAQQVMAAEDSLAAKSEAELRPQQMMTSEDPSVPAVESETEPKRQQVTASENYSVTAVKSKTLHVLKSQNETSVIRRRTRASTRSERAAHAQSEQHPTESTMESSQRPGEAAATQCPTQNALRSEPDETEYDDSRIFASRHGAYKIKIYQGRSSRLRGR